MEDIIYYKVGWCGKINQRNKKGKNKRIPRCIRWD